MTLLSDEIFVCVDCEATGLDIDSDAIIELAAVKFTLNQNLESFETLIDPCQIIPEQSMKIHRITNEMVQGKPKIKEILPSFLKFIGHHMIVGHGIKFDIDMIIKAAKNNQVLCNIEKQQTIDTLRLARLYGQTSVNSLEILRQHFNIVSEGAHRAMNDVLVNIEVFKHLSKDFKTTQNLLSRLQKPIIMKTMPLGKYKGRGFHDIPTDYLTWASHQNFDQDLLFSIRTELKKRKRSPAFSQACNPFSSL
jgi:DNA polymerase-3 subunit epsilon